MWEAYSTAYLARYGVAPTGNAMVRRQACELVDRLGETHAVEVVRFFVERTFAARYVERAHPIGLCLMDAEGLSAQCRTGRALTGGIARDEDRRGTNAEAAVVAMDILRKRREGSQ